VPLCRVICQRHQRPCEFPGGNDCRECTTALLDAGCAGLAGVRTYKFKESVMTAKTSFAIAALVWTLGAPLARSQSVTTIEFPKAMHTRPNGINPSGEIAGTYVIQDPQTKALQTHGFVFDHKGFRSIDVPDAVLTSAFGINPQGDVVGFYNS